MDKEKQQEEEEEEEEEEDRFKDVFKYYKRRQPPPDLSRAIDGDSCSAEVEVLRLPPASERDKAIAREAGLSPPHTWTVHSLVNHPGLVIVRNPFTRRGQLVWGCRCLRDMATHHNRTNLATHGTHLQDRTWWQLCRTKEGQRSGLRQKLRWVTLGYHHNWDTKEYSEDMRGDMPETVVQLCGVVARVVGLCGSSSGSSSSGFKAEAAIINYYHSNSTLGPHTDHSEPYMCAPLLSFSFGQSAVFLIGGPTKATAPSAVLLHSGDIVVMAGAARLCYHAVPRILLRGECRRRRRRSGEEEMEEEEEPWATEVYKEEEEEDRCRNVELGIERKNGEEKEEIIMEEKEEEEENKCRNIELGIETEMMMGRKIEGKDELIKEEKKKEQKKGQGTELRGKPKETRTRKTDNNNDDDNDDDDDLSDILDYLRTCRINMNLRQVLPPAMDRLPL